MSKECLVLGYTDTGFTDPYLCSNSHEAFEKIMQTIKTIFINHELLPKEAALYSSNEIFDWSKKIFKDFFQLKFLLAFTLILNISMIFIVLKFAL